MRQIKTIPGYTLFEILLVIAAIAILTGLLLWSINVGSIFGRIDDSTRENDISSIQNAAEQYFLQEDEYKNIPYGAEGVEKEVCDSGSSSDEDYTPPTDVDCVDLSYLVPGYLNQIPRDPNIEELKATNDTIEQTGYFIAHNEDNDQVSIYAQGSDTREVVINPLPNLQTNDPSQPITTAGCDQDTGQPTNASQVLNEINGDGTSSNPYQISNICELQAIEADLDANYVVTNDITASKTQEWNSGAGFDPLGDATSDNSFCGRFDGAGYQVSDLHINRLTEDYVGLFGYVDNHSGNTGACSIENIHLANLSVQGSEYVGGIVGYLTHGYSSGSSIRRSSVQGSVTGNQTTGTSVGGIIGSIPSSNGSLKQSYAISDVVGYERVGGVVGNVTSASVDNSYAQGTVEGNNNVGGFVGSIGSGDIFDSYSSGEVLGNSNTGGFAGYRGTYSANMNATYWDTEASGTSDATGAGGDGGITGLTTSEMQGSAAETNMSIDFTNTWQTKENPDDYPWLQWQGN